MITATISAAVVSVVIYTKSYCSFCVNAKRFFDERKIAYKEIDLTNSPSEMAKLIKETGLRTVPQIFINNDFIGGFSELSSKYKEGKLTKYGLK